MITKKLTQEEAELIEMIRNLQKAYPRGYDELLYECQRLFDEMVDMPKD